jgi:hypothetical protein
VLEVLRDLGHAAVLYEGALRALATVAASVREWMAAYAMREPLDELEVAVRVVSNTRVWASAPTRSPRDGIATVSGRLPFRPSRR